MGRLEAPPFLAGAELRARAAPVPAARAAAGPADAAAAAGSGAGWQMAGPKAAVTAAWTAGGQREWEAGLHSRPLAARAASLHGWQQVKGQQGYESLNALTIAWQCRQVLSPASHGATSTSNQQYSQLQHQAPDQLTNRVSAAVPCVSHVSPAMHHRQPAAVRASPATPAARPTAAAGGGLWHRKGSSSSGSP